jgi:hypothetical protein
LTSDYPIATGRIQISSATKQQLPVAELHNDNLYHSCADCSHSKTTQNIFEIEFGMPPSPTSTTSKDKAAAVQPDTPAQPASPEEPTSPSGKFWVLLRGELPGMCTTLSVTLFYYSTYGILYTYPTFTAVKPWNPLENTRTRAIHNYIRR